MKIFVTVKQVPDTSGKVAVNEDGTLNRASMQTIINPDDLNAVEQALTLKEEFGYKVVAFTMGPMPAEGMLRELMAMGVGETVLVSAREFGGSDTYATSQIQVGPQIAEKLHLPQVTYAGEVTKEGESLIIKRMLEDGYMLVKVPTPCMITCIKELNTPRYMSVIGTEKCWDMPLKIMDFAALENHPLIDKTTIGLKGSPTNIYKSFTPPVKGGGMMLEGSDKNTTDELVSILTGKHII